MIALPLQERVRAAAAKINMSPRERGLLFLALGAGSLWWASASYEGAQARKDIAETARIERLAEEQRQASLSDARFRQAISDQANRVGQWAIAERTVFIAQMQAQAELESFAREAGLSNLEILVDRPGPARAGIQPLTMVIESDFEWRSFLMFLALIEQSGPSITPVAIEVSSATVPHRMSITVQMMYLAGKAR